MASKTKSISLTATSDAVKKGFGKKSNELMNSAKTEVETLIELPKEQPITTIAELYKATKESFKTQISDIVKIYCKRYEEINWLASKANVTCEGNPSNKQKISSIMFNGEDHIEFDKTVVSIFCILWVLEKDYESFTACQNHPAKLTQASFDGLHNYVVGILTCPEAIDATKKHFEERRKTDPLLVEPKTEEEWRKLAYEEAAEALIVSTVLNDLGKVESVVQRVRARTAIEEVDHDKILLMGLSTHPNEFTSFLRLGQMHRDWLLEGLKAQFNFAQLVQAENVPGTLLGIEGLSKMSLDMFNLHALFDMAGAAGHVNYNGAVVLTEPTYHDVFLIIRCIENGRGGHVNQIYDDYLQKRGIGLGSLSSSNTNQRAILRICCNLRYHTKAEADDVIKVFNELPAPVKNNLRKELSITGIEGTWAILLYYAPALLTNTQLGKKTRDLHAIECALHAMNKCYIAARKHIQDRKGNGVFTADIANVASLAKVNVDDLMKASIEVVPIGEDCKLITKLE